jgi:hypothetical protein
LTATAGPALRGVLLALVAVWLAFALGINWAGAPESLFVALSGNTSRILHGEVWRLFTAPFLHEIRHNVGHLLTPLLGFYFLGPSLESHWGSGRFLRSRRIGGVRLRLPDVGARAAPRGRAHSCPNTGSGGAGRLRLDRVGAQFRGRTINLSS